MSITQTRDEVESVGPNVARDQDGQASSTAWQIDPKASRVEFSIHKRLLVVPLTVVGRFSDVQGTIDFDGQDAANARATVTIGAASVDTRQSRRDAHLRAADFFDVAKHPAITFQSRQITVLNRATGQLKVVGDLTVRGVTREVTLDAQYETPRGTGRSKRMTLNASGSLNRRDFGIVFNTPFIGIGDVLTVALEIQATAE